ncbi:alpha beta-hydrolase [Obba rivulosa]|uniref:Carboxylic ester hydrolase n=1 Tax=Obba rivulosa TaxID=1052685 RepID=A0A8E2AYE0_9APHY|nr:alpha beta-hydrolase [Obba rivulosa]
MSLVSTLGLSAGSAYATPSLKSVRDPPAVVLDNGTFIGVHDGVVDRYLGIPFALPPTGDMRFRLPVPNTSYNATYNATDFGMDCPQQNSGQSTVDDVITEEIAIMLGLTRAGPRPSGEDCLTINVWTPSDIQPGANLSVLAWIFGGGFEVGSTADYDGANIVRRSIDLGEPVIYVSMNYRSEASFGFLASKEVKEAGVGNLGLWDQRQALRWIQRYIGAFGGDPTKVTIWGESAGGISVALQMLTNGGDTEGLFRAAVMASGSPIPVGDIANGQTYYDDLVRETNCTAATDTLECLRHVPYNRLKEAVDMTPGLLSPQSLNLAWLPRADGRFLIAPPQQLVLNDSVADVPFITGDCDDEGTIFSITQIQFSTSEQFEDWFINTYMPTVPDEQIDEVLRLYPDDPSQGSPFGTGNFTLFFPRQFKRMAAIQGDLVFQAPRRFFLQQRSGKQNAWAYLDKRFKSVPLVGLFHGSDLQDFYGSDGSGILADYLVNFVNHLDPKNQTGLEWPKYSDISPSLFTLSGQDDSISITPDNFRMDAMGLLTNLSLQFPL